MQRDYGPMAGKQATAVDFIKDDNAPETLLSQFEIVKGFIADLQNQFEEVESALARPKLDADKLKKMINAATIMLIQMKSFCP
jgi:hypothetical protein